MILWLVYASVSMLKWQAVNWHSLYPANAYEEYEFTLWDKGFSKK